MDHDICHLGTNDVFQFNSLESSTAELGLVIDTLRQDTPNIAVFIAQLIPLADSTRNPGIDALNQRIPNIVADKNQVDSPVILVDQNTGFNANTDTYDGVHPNESGEAKIAERWFEALQTFFESINSTNNFARLDEALDFNASQYLASYSDLIAAFGPNLAAATAHYQQSGLLEERSSDLFDEVRYLASYGDLITAFGKDYAAATEHYVNSGLAEGRTTDIFDPVSYLNNYADLQMAFGNNLFAATEHYIQFGFGEGRVPGPSGGYNGRLDEFLSFDPLQYLASYEDLINSFGFDLIAATAHYQQSGLLEERSSDLFDEVRYLASYGDLITAFGDNYAAATEHYVNSGLAEGRTTDLFDPVGYLNNYADLQVAFGNNLFAAAQHYILAGFAEGRVF